MDVNHDSRSVSSSGAQWPPPLEYMAVWLGKVTHSGETCRHYLSQMRSFWEHVPLIWSDESSILPVVFLPKAHNVSLIKEKTSDKSQRHPPNTWPVLLKTAEVIENKENLRNYHSHKESKDAWQRNVIWDPGWDPGTERGQNQRSLNELWTLVVNNI